MSLQNGLNNQAILSRFVSKSKIIYGTTMAPADLIRPFEVSSHGDHKTELKSTGNFSKKHAEYINSQLNNSGLNSSINQNVDETIWHKVAFNSAMNSICALIEKTPNYISSNMKLKTFAENVGSVHATDPHGQVCGVATMHDGHA